MKKIKETIKDNFILEALLYSLLVYLLFAPFTKLFFMVTSDFFVEKTIIEDTNNLYPDEISEIYLVDNQNDPLRDLSRYSYLAPIIITNNYEQEKAYEMSLSLSKTYLSQKMRKEQGYKSSFGKYAKIRDNRKLPILMELITIGKLPTEFPDFYTRIRKMSNFYNPAFIGAFESTNTLTIPLQPKQTSEAFYLDFPISHWEESYLNKGAFELRIVRKDGYYPVTIKELVDCRSEIKNKDDRCNTLPQ